jgi:glycine reductase
VFESEGPLEPRVEGRPRFAYIGQVHSRQRVAEVDEQIVYGANTAGMLPAVLHPNEWLDGGVLTGNYRSSVETYFYQNHPVISELYRWHQQGKISLVGTIATMAGSNNYDRDLNAMVSAELAKWNLGADGVVLTKCGGGAPHSDMAITARNCELLGMRTTVQIGPPDLSGDRTAESSMLFNYEEVDAIVYSSGGNYIQLPVAPVERVIAPTAAAAAGLESLSQVAAGRICGITSQQGGSRLRTFVY